MNNVEAVASKQYTKSAFFYCTMSIGPNLISVLESVLPRILTQACRDVGNPAYGCFDRNWWHYRIRDFASIILQQGGYAVYTASKVCDPSLAPPAFAASLAAGSCRFWNARAVRHGAFEEYYPWEQGYPPLAFSTLAVAKLVAEGFIPEKEVHAGLAIAAKQLATRFEPKAANQQIAGLAGEGWMGPASKAMATAAAPYVAWLAATAEQAEQIRSVMAVVFPEAVTLVREARQGLQ